MRSDADFDAFYAGSVRRVIGQVHAMTGSLSEAEDAVQEAYARAWQRWGTISGYADPEAWVRMVAFRIGVSSWRRAKSRVRAQHRHGPPDDVAGLSADYVALVAALREISPDQREAIVLYHLVGMSVQEIATQAGVPAGTIKARLARGRRALAAKLDDSPRAHIAPADPAPMVGLDQPEVPNNV